MTAIVAGRRRGHALPRARLRHCIGSGDNGSSWHQPSGDGLRWRTRPERDRPFGRPWPQLPRGAAMTMIDAAMPMHNAMAVPAGGARRATFRRLIRRLRLGVRMHHLLFMAFILVAAVPVIVLALWDEKTSY